VVNVCLCRTVSTLRKHGVPIATAGQEVQQEDYNRFTHILAMDKENLADLRRDAPKGSETLAEGAVSPTQRPRPPKANQTSWCVCVFTGSKATIRLFGSYGDDGKEIQDPYYGGISGFEKAYKQCVKYSEGLLKDLGFDKGKDRVR
jgi:low molecular weight phosphotyrosine protein phosphatase